MSKNVENIVSEFENALLNLLIEKIKTDKRKEFLISDAFDKEWSRIPSTTRKNIGRKFAILVKNREKEVQNVEFLKKDSANKQWYKNKNSF